MSTETELDQLRKHVQYLLDRTAILDCISSHSRGHDRHDVDLITEAYHSDGFDQHGNVVNPGPEYHVLDGPGPRGGIAGPHPQHHHTQLRN